MQPLDRARRSARCSTTPSAPGRSTHPPFNKLGLAKRTRVARKLPARADIDRMLLARRRADAAELRRVPVHDRVAGDPAGRVRRAALGPARLRRRHDHDRPAVVGEGRAVQGAQARLDIESCRWSRSCASGSPSCRASPSSCSRPCAARTTRRAAASITGTACVARSGSASIELYLATRHFFVTYAIEQLGLSVEDIGWYCGHRGAGGRIVRDHYLHPDDDARRERIAEKFELIEHDTGQRSLDGQRARSAAQRLRTHQLGGAVTFTHIPNPDLLVDAEECVLCGNPTTDGERRLLTFGRLGPGATEDDVVSPATVPDTSAPVTSSTSRTRPRRSAVLDWPPRLARSEHAHEKSSTSRTRQVSTRDRGSPLGRAATCCSMR